MIQKIRDGFKGLAQKMKCLESLFNAESLADCKCGINQVLLLIVDPPWQLLLILLTKRPCSAIRTENELLEWMYKKIRSKKVKIMNTQTFRFSSSYTPYCVRYHWNFSAWCF